MLVPACFSGNRVVMCKRRPYCFQLKHCTVVSGYRMGEGNWSHCPRLLRAITWVKRFSCHCWYWYCTSQSALCISNSCIAHSEEESFERETLGWKLESLHCKCQRGLAFLESNAREVLLFLRVTPLSDWSLTRQLGWEDFQSQASIAILRKKERRIGLRNETVQRGTRRM